jgi:Fur family ferric uptake transcriptional regulator
MSCDLGGTVHAAPVCPSDDTVCLLVTSPASQAAAARIVVRLTDTEYHLIMVASSSDSPAFQPAPVLAVLARSGYRVTAPRRSVVELIVARDGPFTASDLEEAARRRGSSIGRATVFRTLELLLGLEVVERIDLPSGEHAYVACDPAHHHHVVCTSCGQTSEVGDLGLDAILRDVASRTGVRIDRHRLELFGVCADCRAIGQ